MFDSLYFALETIYLPIFSEVKAVIHFYSFKVGAFFCHKMKTLIGTCYFGHINFFEVRAQVT